METTKTARDMKNGQYVCTNDFDRLCRCGHTLGVHAAATVAGRRDCFNGDTGEPCECTKFRKPVAR